MICSGKSNFTIHTAIRATESIKKENGFFIAQIGFKEVSRNVVPCCVVITIRAIDLKKIKKKETSGVKRRRGQRVIQKRECDSCQHFLACLIYDARW